MTLTSAQRVRLRIQDAPTLEDKTYYGDGTANVFPLPHLNLTTASAYVPGAAGWTATGAAFNASGQVAFSGIISANSAFRLTYTYSTFSDEEVSQFLTDGGSIAGAALEAVGALMFDALKRARWMASDGTQYDDTMGQNHLREMYALLVQETKDEATAGGSIDSWSLAQGDY